jgi:hypothetical protein
MAMRQALALAMVLAFPGPAGADAMVYEQYAYRTRVDGNTVTVCADNVSPTGCGHSFGSPPPVMLRQDTKTGAVVELPRDLYGEIDTQLCPGNFQSCCLECFVDECVPPGTYRYGEAPALPHCGEYYGEVTVTSPLPAGCTPKNPPEATSVEPPWINVAGNDRECPSDGCDCALGSPARAVLGVQVGLFIIGLALYLRRRRST